MARHAGARDKWTNLAHLALTIVPDEPLLSLMMAEAMLEGSLHAEARVYAETALARAGRIGPPFEERARQTLARASSV